MASPSRFEKTSLGKGVAPFAWQPFQNFEGVVACGLNLTSPFRHRPPSVLAGVRKARKLLKRELQIPTARGRLMAKAGKLTRESKAGWSRKDGPACEACKADDTRGRNQLASCCPSPQHDQLSRHK